MKIDYSKMIGQYFGADSNSVWKILSVDTIKRLYQYEFDYTKQKGMALLDNLIDSNGEITQYHYKWINKTEWECNKSFVLSSSPFQTSISANYISNSTKVIDQCIIKKCDCGSKITYGLKDYQIGHSDFCEVYHKKKA